MIGQNLPAPLAEISPSFDENVTAVIADRLLSLTVIDEEGGSADRLDIQLDDRDPS